MKCKIPILILFSSASIYSQSLEIDLSAAVFFGDDYSLDVYGTTNSGSVGLNIVGNNLSSNPSSTTLGGEFAWYFANACDVIDTSFTASGTQLFGNIVSSPGSIDLSLNPTFSLGVWFDDNLDSTINSGDVFGWANFEYDGTNLNLVNSDVSVGSVKVIPEPTTGVLSALSIMTLLFSRRRRLVSCGN